MEKENIAKTIMLMLAIIIGIILIFLFNNKSDNSIEFDDDSVEANVKLSLLGNNVINIYKGNTYKELGYVIMNTSNTNNYNVKINNNVNYNQIGSYDILYQLFDKNNNLIDKVTRTIVVEEDPIASVKFSLMGSSEIYLLLNDKYVEPGFSAIRDDSDISESVSISGNVDINNIGIYKLIYKLTIDGKSKTLTRIVNIMDIPALSSVSTEELTNQNVIITIKTISNNFWHMELPNGNRISTNVIEYPVSTNGNYSFKIYNRFNLFKEYNVIVNNIDKEKPQGTCIAKSGVVTINASDTSGIKSYEYKINNGNYLLGNSRVYDSKIINPKSVKVRITDNVSNSQEITCNITTAIGSGYVPRIYTDGLGYRCLYPYTCFKQTDYNDQYQAIESGPGPISGTGCMPTSMTIVLSGFDIRDKGNNIYNPSTLVNNFIYADGKIKGYSNGGYLKQYFKKLGLTATDCSYSQETEKLRAHLRSGYPAIMWVGKGCYTNNGHFLAILAINNNDEVFLSDPYSKKTTSFIGRYNGYTCSDNTWVPLMNLGKMTEFYAIYLISK